MSNTYTLNILQMTVAPTHDGLSNVVVNAVWQYCASDGVFLAKGPISLSEFAYAPGSPFTPYSQLTQEQVADWVLSSWTPSQTSLYQKQLADNIAAQKLAQYATVPLPWKQQG